MQKSFSGSLLIHYQSIHNLLNGDNQSPFKIEFNAAIQKWSQLNIVKNSLGEDLNPYHILQPYWIESKLQPFLFAMLTQTFLLLEKHLSVYNNLTPNYECVANKQFS